MLLSRAYKMMISSWHLPIFQLCRSPCANCFALLSNASMAWILVSLEDNTVISIGQSSQKFYLSKSRYSGPKIYSSRSRSCPK